MYPSDKAHAGYRIDTLLRTTRKLLIHLSTHSTSMKHPHIVNTVTAIILIIVGGYSYLANESRPISALITGPGVGLVLLALTPGIKKDNRVIAHIAVVLTLLLGVAALFMGARTILGTSNAMNIDENGEVTRRIVVLFTMALTCLVAVSLYVGGFIQKRKARQQAAQVK